MGLQDLLAIVLGVKTAEALEERRTAQANLASLRPRTPAERRAAVDQLMAANAPIQARFLLAASPIIAAIEPRDVYPPDAPALKDGRKLKEPGPDDFLIFIAGLYAADLAHGDPDRYERGIANVTLVNRSFGVNTQWAGQLRSKYGALFDQLVDVHLDEVSLGVGDNLRQIRTNLRLPPLARLPKEKVCPRCAERIKAAAAVCRYCGYEYQGREPERPRSTASGSTAGASVAAPAWAPTDRVPDEGMVAWAKPDPTLQPAVTLSGRLDLIVAERAGDWARVVAVNGWTGWVDGRRLVPQPTAQVAHAITSPETAAVQFQVAYERIEDVINDDLGHALASGAAPAEATARWASSATPRLGEYRATMRACRGFDPRVDAVLGRIDRALEAYEAATAALVERRPDGLALLEQASSHWHEVQSLVMTTTGFQPS